MLYPAELPGQRWAGASIPQHHPGLGGAGIIFPGFDRVRGGISRCHPPTPPDMRFRIRLATPCKHWRQYRESCSSGQRPRFFPLTRTKTAAPSVCRETPRNHLYPTNMDPGFCRGGAGTVGCHEDLCSGRPEGEEDVS
jgi:hypothetical protein